MVEGNATNSVRSKIDALVGAQEARDGAQQVVDRAVQNKVEKKVVDKRIVDDKQKKALPKKRLYVIMMSAFGVVIVGLVVAIVIALKPWEIDITEDIVANKDNTSVEATAQRLERSRQAIQDCSEIESNYKTGVIDYDGAIEDFDRKMLSSDPVYNIYFAICYAGHVYDNSGDADSAIGIIEKTDSQLENVNNSIASDYYVALRTLYKKLGDDDMVTYYDSVINEILYDGNMDYEIEGESDA